MAFVSSFVTNLKQMPPDAVQGLAIFFGFNALSLLLVTYAFLRPSFLTKAVGIFCGICMFAFWTTVGFAVFKGMRMAAEHRRALENMPRADATSAHQVTGTKLPYKITMPAVWKTFWSKPDLDLGMHDGAGLYVGIVTDNSVGTAIDAVNRTRERLKTKGRNVKFSELVPVQIDGRTWLRFTAQWQREISPLDEVHEQLNVYSGPEGVFEIVGWRGEAFHQRDEERLSEIAASFRFPPRLQTSPAVLHFQMVQPTTPFATPKTAP